MKRLVRKANIDYNTFLKLLLNDNIYSQEEVNKVISDNSDCIYSGEAFRVFFFYKDEVKTAKEKALKDLNVEDVSQADIFDILWGTLDNLIQINGEYQSFAKSENGVRSAESHLNDGQDFAFTIKLEVSGALDVEKLFEKYKDQLDEETKEAFNYFSNQEEVLAKLDNDEYFYISGFQDMSELRYL